MRRINALDFLRGIGIIGVVFLHSSLYHYANLLKIDFKNPPAIVTIIGMLLMWAGLFALVSGAVTAIQYVRRHTQEKKNFKELLRLSTLSGFVLLVTSYIYFWIVGPAILDRVNGNHDYSFLMNFMVKGQFQFPSFERIIYVDSLTMMALNILITGLILFFLFRKGGFDKKKRNYWIIGTLAAVFVLLSYIRIPLYPIMEEAIKGKNLLMVIPMDYFINKNNPILPYLGFGLFGTLLGLFIANKEKWSTIWKTFSIIGLIFLIAGVVGYVTLPDTMLERAIDEMWLYIIIAQVGLFLFMALAALKYFDFGKNALGRYDKQKIIRRFGKVSLTVFMLETPLSELFSKILSVINPNWNQTIGATLIFAAVIVVFWGFVIYFWEKNNFKYSFEWIIVKVFKHFGKKSTKLSF
ncbi:MAG: acyltransferase [Candidatus Saccharibacteria bacterium]